MQHLVFQVKPQVATALTQSSHIAEGRRRKGKDELVEVSEFGCVLIALTTEVAATQTKSALGGLYEKGGSQPGFGNQHRFIPLLQVGQ